MRFNFVLFHMMLIIFLALPTLAFNIDKTAYLSTGWDTSGPLSMGKVSWADQIDGFSVEFELKGANPNQQYTVGAYLFNRNNTADYPNINQFLGWFVDKATITVENRTASTEVWDFGYLTTDQNGNGKAKFKCDVPVGIYYAQFTVRTDHECSPYEGRTNGCDVVYRTGTGFANDLETIIIERSRPRKIDYINLTMGMDGLNEEKFTLGIDPRDEFDITGRIGDLNIDSNTVGVDSRDEFDIIGRIGDLNKDSNTVGVDSRDEPDEPSQSEYNVNETNQTRVTDPRDPVSGRKP